ALAAPSKIIMDSGVWIGATTDGAGVVTPEALLILEQAAHQERLHVSVASVWEMTKLANDGVIVFGNYRDWLTDQLRPPGIRLVSIDEHVAYEAALLPPIMPRSEFGNATALAFAHILTATARCVKAVLVTTMPSVIAYAEQYGVDVYDARA